MNCADAREVLLAHQRGALASGEDAAVREHLASCAACARVETAERALTLAMTPLLYQRFVVAPAQRDALVTEAVNDHVRVLLSERPMEAESGDIHQVKPWFAGRLDFAPAVAFGGDGEFPLRGGAVGYFLDRRAAVFLYSRRRHAISLFVVRAEGLPWPANRLETSSRGFRVIVWRAGELGYLLVSDVDAGELRTLAAKVMGESA